MSPKQRIDTQRMKINVQINENTNFKVEKKLSNITKMLIKTSMKCVLLPIY